MTNQATDLEFRWPGDDAWYDAEVAVDGDAITLKYKGFSEMEDEIYRARDFQTPEAVDEFCRRFRAQSQPLDDSQCSVVVKGMTVVAACKVDDLCRYFDAVIDSVCKKEHTYENEVEKCLCNFLLFWKDGPIQGSITSSDIANICLIRPTVQLDLRVISFSKLAKERIEISSIKLSSISGAVSSFKGDTTSDRENGVSSSKAKSSSSQQRFQEMERQLICAVGTSEGSVDQLSQQYEQDRDLGGYPSDITSINESSSHHFFIIENLDKEISASAIIEFIYNQTSISAGSYVFPSLLSETYTRGVIITDCEMKLRKIYEFLSNPDRIIITSRGRPWVITEKTLRSSTSRMNFGSFMPKSQDNSQIKNNNELKIISSGSEEYRTAKQLRDLFLEFMVHQQRLHQAFHLQGREILQPSCAV